MRGSEGVVPFFLPRSLVRVSRPYKDQIRGQAAGTGPNLEI